MRYKNEDANRYRVSFMRSTEKLMDKLTVKEFILYLEENAKIEDTTCEYIDGKTFECKMYDLKEDNSNLHKQFLVTSDGRVFYWRTLMDKFELIDDEKNKPAAEMKSIKMLEGMTTEQLLDQFELTTNMKGQHVPTIRGWYMDEIEKRHPEAFDKWLDEDWPEDSHLRKCIFG